MKFRWLGVAGIELAVGDELLVIDPYFTRASFRNLWFGRVQPDVEEIRRRLPACDHLLITHAHFDHVMDAAEVLRYSGAQGYGSSNACQLMAALGTPVGSLHTIFNGDSLDCGSFMVNVHLQAHSVTPIDRWINGDLLPNLDPPLRLVDYRMDESFGFCIQAEDLRILVRDMPMEADVFFTVPLKPIHFYEKLLSHIRPKLVIPIHWDDFFRPLSKPLRPSISPSGLALPPVKRFDPKKFKHQIESLECGCRVLVPEIFDAYVLENEM